jgi:hypothetical protein
MNSFRRLTTAVAAASFGAALLVSAAPGSGMTAATAPAHARSSVMSGPDVGWPDHTPKDGRTVVGWPDAPTVEA